MAYVRKKHIQDQLWQWFKISICAKAAHKVPTMAEHDDVIEWKRFPRYWPFVREIHR